MAPGSGTLISFDYEPSPVARNPQSCVSSLVPGLGQAGQAGTSHWKAGGLCPHPLPTSHPLVLWDLHMQSQEMAGRAYGGLGLLPARPLGGEPVVY